jgi:hypothetical protein
MSRPIGMTDKDVASGDPQCHPSDITAQEVAHDMGEACDEEDCQECCGDFIGHDHDPDEGMMCINCGKEWEGGE